MHSYHLYGIGAALVDTEIAVSDQDLKDLQIEKGSMTLVDEQRQYELMKYLADHLVASKRASGGSAANTIIASRYFGADTFYSCKVANDDNGTFYLNDLREAGVHYHSGNGKTEGITGKCLVMITPDGERTMTTFLGASESVSNAELDEKALAASQFVYVEGYLVSSESGRSAAIRARQLAEQQGVKTAMSLSDPAIVRFFRDGLHDMLGEGVDILFCNQAEALGFTEKDTLSEATLALQQYAKNFVITCGHEGALVFNGRDVVSIAPHVVDTLDTNGAGDMFAGAFLYGITHGHSHEAAGKLASLASATVVSQFGPRLEAKQHDQIKQRVLRALNHTGSAY